MSKTRKKNVNKVVIKGGYGLGNFGDDALMVAAYEFTKRTHGAESVSFMCNDADYLSRLLGVETATIMPAQLGHIGADFLIYGGGTQFYSFIGTSAKRKRRIDKGLFNSLVPYLLSPKKLARKIAKKITGSQLAVSKNSTAALGIGVGPFIEDCEKEKKVRALFLKMNYVAVRDRFSYELCSKWGVENLFLRADLCYLSNLWTSALARSCDEDNSRRISNVGVIVRDWMHTFQGGAYGKSLMQLVEELRSEGKNVQFISFSRRDRDWTQRLIAEGEQLLAWDPQSHTIPEFLEILSGFDVYITARFHGAVFASLLNRPVICIEVEVKLRLVSDLFGHGSRLWSYPFNVEDCLKHLRNLEVDYSNAIADLKNVVHEQTKLVEIMLAEYQRIVLQDVRIR